MKKSNAGFSLVELMVVVAIIGVLAAIAVPNYQRFQAKARQSEAKGALSAMYTAEKSYFIETDTYSILMANIGYSPDGGLKSYNVGFDGGTATSSAPPAVAGAATNRWTCNGVAAYCVPGTDVPAAAGVAGATFDAYAIGRVNGVGDDTWAIDENRVLVNTAPAL